MFPGQLYRDRASIAADGIVSITLFMRRENCCVKCRTRSGISPWRSRKAGTCTGKTFKRKKRSGRNFCWPTIASRSRFVAAIKRASVRSVRELPSRSNSLSCSTRSSLVCNSRGISPISSRKNRATFGHFERPNAFCDRSGECPFLVSEQLAFQQARRNGRAVELHEGFRPPWAQIMNGAGDQFLSRPRLAINQDRRVRRRYRFYMFEDFAQRGTVSNDLSKIHFRADFIFQIQLLFGELVFELSNLPKRKCILHGNGNLICDLGQKLNIASERIVLIFDHTECAQHATAANKRKDADRSDFGLCCVLQSQPPRLLDAAAPKFSGAKDCSRDILIEGDKALLLDGFVAKGKIESVDPQMCVVAIG